VGTKIGKSTGGGLSGFNILCQIFVKVKEFCGKLGRLGCS